MMRVVQDMKNLQLDADQILDYLTTAVVVTDFNRRIARINQAAEHILGVSKKRGIGVLLDEVVDLNDIDRAAIQACIEYGRPFTKRQAQIRTSQQHTINVDFTVSPVSVDEEEFLVIEFTELDRILRINREESQLAAHDTARQLARGLAHEIKNPLGGLRGAAQLLHQELEDEGLKEYTSVITEEADRLRNLVDRMLGPNQLPQFNPMNLHEALERVVILLEVESANRIRFIKDYDPSLPNVQGDLEQLIQAILNITRNAVESLSEATTKQPTILLKTRIQHRHTIGNIQHPLVCRIDIIDNGPGIPKQILDEIFYPMITGRSTGTGLGLPISQSILSNHGGTIEYLSEPGKTEFSIFLPAQYREEE
jgi:two-component system, NtrC family, nitrogen regulation sensor histidine kinase GlnL